MEFGEVGGGLSDGVRPTDQKAAKRAVEFGRPRLSSLMRRFASLRVKCDAIAEENQISAVRR